MGKLEEKKLKKNYLFAVHGWPIKIQATLLSLSRICNSCMKEGGRALYMYDGQHSNYWSDPAGWTKRGLQFHWMHLIVKGYNILGSQVRALHVLSHDMLSRIGGLFIPIYWLGFWISQYLAMLSLWASADWCLVTKPNHATVSYSFSPN